MDVKVYPDRTHKPEISFGPKVLGLATSQLMAWRQSAGSFGALHLHACWGESSALARHYHGQTVALLCHIYNGVRELAKRKTPERWKNLADAIIQEILYLQMPTGGFCHASGEFEPVYDSSTSCPIHQMLPVLALLDHLEGQDERAPVRVEIENVLKRHLAWFRNEWWMHGNGWVQPLTTPGWCGVTNQDLVVVAALARYGEVLGDWTAYDNEGKPALDAYLSDVYYSETFGLFERGDREGFSERTSYMCLIADMLDEINRIRPDVRIQPVLRRIAEVLAEAVYTDDTGACHVAWGVDDKRTRDTGQRVWMRQNRLVSEYVNIIDALMRYSADPMCESTRAKIEGLEKTVASYVFEDGTIPTALGQENDLFAIVPSGTSLVSFWRFLIRRNAEGVGMDELPNVPAVRRECGGMQWSSFSEGWLIRDAGSVLFSGIKQWPHGVFSGEIIVPDTMSGEPCHPYFRECVMMHR